MTLCLKKYRTFADWVFGRNCDDIACGGKVWLSMWGTVAVLTVVNAIVWGITDLVRNYRRRKVPYHRGSAMSRPGSPKSDNH